LIKITDLLREQRGKINTIPNVKRIVGIDTFYCRTRTPLRPIPIRFVHLTMTNAVKIEAHHFS